MVIDLNPLPYTLVLHLIRWCFDHGIDRDKCLLLLEQMSTTPVEHDEEIWSLDIPEKYVNWLLLSWRPKWSTNE